MDRSSQVCHSSRLLAVISLLFVVSCTLISPNERTFVDISTGSYMASITPSGEQKCGMIRYQHYGYGTVDPSGQDVYTSSLDSSRVLSVISLATGKNISEIRTNLANMSPVVWANNKEIIVTGEKSRAFSSTQEVLEVINDLPKGHIVRIISLGYSYSTEIPPTPVVRGDGVLVLINDPGTGNFVTLDYVDYKSGKIARSVPIQNNGPAGWPWGIYVDSSRILVYGTNLDGGSALYSLSINLKQMSLGMVQNLNFFDPIYAIEKDPLQKSTILVLAGSVANRNSLALEEFDPRSDLVRSELWTINSKNGVVLWGPPAMAIDSAQGWAYISVPTYNGVSANLWRVPIGPQVSRRPSILLPGFVDNFPLLMSLSKTVVPQLRRC